MAFSNSFKKGKTIGNDHIKYYSKRLQGNTFFLYFFSQFSFGIEQISRYKQVNYSDQVYVTSKGINTWDRLFEIILLLVNVSLNFQT